MHTKLSIRALLMLLAVAAGYIVYATCGEEHPPYWKCASCTLDPANRVNVSSGQTINWEGSCTFDYYEWWEIIQRYVISDSCNQLDASRVENRWTGSGTLSYSGSNDQKCDQTVPSVSVSDGAAGGSILYKPRLRSDHDIEGRVGDWFTITIIGRDAQLTPSTEELIRREIGEN